MKKLVICGLCLFGLTNCQKTDDALQQEVAQKQEAPTPATSARLGVNGIIGVNWADERDNFANDFLLLSGLAKTDNYATVQTKADKVLSGFQNLGINTVRLPLNPQTVLQSGWASYQGAIDKALSKNMKVILAVWENGSFASNGRITDLNTFYSLWQVVINKYGGNANAYFEPLNEPHGYSVSELKTFYANYLSRYSSVPRGRIVLGGVGFCQDVNTIGSDSQFNGCLLGYHTYTFFASNVTTVNGWDSKYNNDLRYPTRTIMTEYGCPMVEGANYTGAASDNFIPYLQATTDNLHNRGMASVYWPGLRTNDHYSLTTFNGNTLTVTNQSGLTRLRWGWSLTDTPGGPFPAFSASAYYRFVNRNSGKVLDVPGSSVADGAAISQYTFNGGTNQQWRITASTNGAFTITNRNSGKVMDVPGSSTAEGTAVNQYTDNNGSNQDWRITDVGNGYYRIVNRNSGLALDISGGSTADGAPLNQRTSTGGTNQQWQIVAY